MVDGALIVDVRTQEEFDAGHAKGSVHIPLSLFADQFKTIRKNSPEIVVCESGARSAQAVRFLTRLVSIPLLIIMVTAIVTTKIPLFLDEGFWTMAHESRTDFAMTLLLIYLVMYGASKLSIDAVIHHHSSAGKGFRFSEF